MAIPADRLYLGTRRYSSWSMRGWLAVRLAGIDAVDVVVPLAGGRTPALAGLTPAGLVPSLTHRGVTIWDSLAICEYCAEHAPALWPRHPAARAVARSVAAEMHAGFRELRLALPMNLGRQPDGRVIADEAVADIARIETVWSDCLRAGGPFLFGERMTIPDVMYAPVVARFLGYGPALSQTAREYCYRVRSEPEVDAWYRLAADEPVSWRLSHYE